MQSITSDDCICFNFISFFHSSSIFASMGLLVILSTFYEYYTECVICKLNIRIKNDIAYSTLKKDSISVTTSTK